MKKGKKILVGVAWPYVNGDLHIGHFFGNLLPPDIFARYQRLKGNDVLMVSGSDCHGTPTTMQADKEGVSPKEIVKKYHALDIELFSLYMLSYNLYTKTTTSHHKKVSQQMFLDLLKNGYIVVDTMQQYYSPDDNKFLPDRYVEGTCPHCKSTNQRSDQCEKCGRWLEAGEIQNPISKITGSKIVLKDTQHYFLDFAKLEKELREYLDDHKEVWRRWIWAETDGWLREGLRKRAITRDIDWGVDLPIEEIKKLPKVKQLDDFSGKKIYVWFEAVIGYLSAAIEWSEMSQDSEEVIFNRFKGQGTDWKEWWLDSKATIYNFMGQDNLVFHTLMWPAMLMGTKKGYNLPHNVVVNKFANYENKKFSKSRNWTINSKKIAEKYGVDLVRYYIAANFPENKEANFSWNSFVNAINNELVANLGNYIHRTLTFINTHFEGVTPMGTLQNNVAFEIRDTFLEAGKLIEEARLSEGLARIFELASFANRYFDKNAVWKVIKEDKKQAAEILYNCIQLIESLRILLSPYIPSSMEKLSTMLGHKPIEWEVGNDQWKFITLPAQRKLGKIEVLFDKLDLKEVEAAKESLI